MTEPGSPDVVVRETRRRRRHRTRIVGAIVGVALIAGVATISSGPCTYVRPERLDIGGTQVAALHYHRSRNLTGDQTGTEGVNVWFDAATGLPMRNRRVTTPHSSALIGGVTYEENDSFRLASMNPT